MSTNAGAGRKDHGQGGAALDRGRDTRARRVVAGALVVALAGGALLLRRSSRPAVAPRAATAIEASPPAPVAAAPLPLHAIEARVVSQEGPPLVDEITVDKPSPCAGEAVTVGVRAHVPAGTPGELVYRVGDKIGAPATVQVDRPGPARVLVTVAGVGADGRPTAVEQREVLLDVGRCEQREWLEIRRHPLAAADVSGFEAVLPDGGHARGSWRYEWDFGDGTNAVTARPYVEHDFFLRPQVEMQSSYLVRVRATSGGAALEGVTSVGMMNDALQNRRAGVIAPRVASTPARKGKDAVALTLTVTNPGKEAAHIEALHGTMTGCGAGAPRDVEIPVSALSARALPPGRSTVEVRIPAALVGDACHMLVRGDGDGGEGLRLQLSFGAFLGERGGGKTFDPRTAGAAEGKEIARAMTAMRMLGRDPTRGGRVSEEEVQRLVHEGKLQ